jgi:hypothetical protein
VPPGPVLRSLALATARLPLTLLEAVRDLLVYLLRLLLLLLKLLPKLLKGKLPERYEPKDCAQIPPEINRRPDPCLYSQSFLAAQGIAVTWDNPDIMITTTSGVPVPSNTLTADTDYIVVGTIHNASFDPAIGVTVRSYFRGWGVDFADRQPTEVDANGNPAERIVHIGAWGQTTASFKWHTPAHAGHFCVTIECYHPADREPANNVGQENTDVVEGAPGQSARIAVPFFNRRRDAREFTIEVDEYEIPEERVEFRLEPVRAKPLGRDREDRVVDRKIERDALRGSRIRLNRDDRRARLGEQYEVYGYRGRDRLVAANGRGNFEVSEGWAVTLPERKHSEAGWHVDVPPGETATIDVVVSIPERSTHGDRKVLNLTARDRFGEVVGGVTVLVQVVEEHAVP